MRGPLPATDRIRVLLVNHHELRYGAARAAERLRQGLLARGVDAELLVAERGRWGGADPMVHGAPRSLGMARTVLELLFDRLRPALRSVRKAVSFTSQTLPDLAVRQILRLRPDVVHLHWLGNGFCRIESLCRLKELPIVWTLHDMWMFTGGCHYSGDCRRYRESCGRCPQLSSSKAEDLSARVWRRKQQAWDDLEMTLTTPSRWLALEAGSSPLVRGRDLRVIPNGLDPLLFRPHDRDRARQELGLPDKEVDLIAFGAENATIDPRKGFDLLLRALRKHAEQGAGDGGTRTKIVVFGASAGSEAEQIGLPVHFLGRIDDDQHLATMLSACDLFVAPSREDNLPNSVMEAMACGTPCLAFATGGMSDLIDHQSNGFLATPFDVAELASGMQWILSGRERRARLSAAARAGVLAQYDQRLQAERFETLYRELLARRDRRQNNA